MPTNGKGRSPVLVDTSVAVAVAVSDHAAHDATVDALGGRELGLAGHAWFETFSVLTRLPGPARRPAVEVVRLLEHNFPESRFLDADGQRALAGRIAQLAIAGGSTYDALVGAAAVQHELTLLTRDARAVPTYRQLEVAFELI